MVSKIQQLNGTHFKNSSEVDVELMVPEGESVEIFEASGLFSYVVPASEVRQSVVLASGEYLWVR